MNLLPFVQWVEASSAHAAIANSSWAFAVIESVHLLALAAIGGAVLVVDLRMLGLGLKAQPVPELARSAYPWFVGSLVVMLATGIPLFISEPTKCYYSNPFWFKMGSLVLWAAIIVSGRMIAYNWFDCDRPHSHLIHILGSCDSYTQP